MALFISIQEIRNYISVDANTDFNNIRPYVEKAQQEFIQPALGSTLYNALVADHNTNQDNVTNMTQALLDLLLVVRGPLACLSYFLGINIIGVNIGDIGIQVQGGNNSEPAPRWKFENLRNSWLDCGEKGIEALLKFLESNSASYPDWVNSGANTANQGFVPTAEIASRYIAINSSRRLFLRLKPYIHDVEEKVIRKAICDDHYAVLIGEMQAGVFTGKNEALRDKIRPIVAKKALYNAIPLLRIAITDQGMSLLTTTDGYFATSVASDRQVANLRDSLRLGESGFLADQEELEGYVNQNIADFPLIQESPCYTANSDPLVPRHHISSANDGENKHFSV